jgi:hypothetical protein
MFPGPISPYGGSRLHSDAQKGVCHFRHRTRHWRAPNHSPSRRRLHGSIAANDGCGGRHAACRLPSIGCGSHRPVRPTTVDAWRGTRRTVTVRYHAEDLSRAFVTEGTHDYLEVRYADMRRPAFSLFEQRTALKAVRSEGQHIPCGCFWPVVGICIPRCAQAARSPGPGKVLDQRNVRTNHRRNPVRPTDPISSAVAGRADQRADGAYANH